MEEKFTKEEIDSCIEKLIEFYNSVVPEFIRNPENIDAEKEKSFIKHYTKTMDFSEHLNTMNEIKIKINEQINYEN